MTLSHLGVQVGVIVASKAAYILFFVEGGIPGAVSDPPNDFMFHTRSLFVQLRVCPVRQASRASSSQPASLLTSTHFGASLPWWSKEDGEGPIPQLDHRACG